MKSIIGNVLMSFVILGWIKAEITFPEHGVTLNYTHIMFRWTQEPDCNLYKTKKYCPKYCGLCKGTYMQFAVFNKIINYKIL